MRLLLNQIAIVYLTTIATCSLKAQTIKLTDTDVGKPALAGSTKLTTDTKGGYVYTIIGGGSDIWNTADSFHYAYFKITGDFDYMVQAQDLQGPDTWSKAELMARQFATVPGIPQGGDPHISNMATRAAGQNLLTPQWRAVRNGVSDRWTNVTASAKPAYPNTWLRTERIGNVFYLYSSSDGQNWTMYNPGTLDTSSSSPQGGDNKTTFTSAWPATILLGLAVTAHNDTDRTGAKAVFSNFKPHVAVPIAITTQPAAAVSVTVGQTLTLKVVASGDPLHYQWRKNGADIPGATLPNFTISAVTAADAGTYSVRLYGAGAQVISQNSVVTTTPIVVPSSTVATIRLNNYDANMPIYYKTTGTPAGSGQLFHVQLLGGPVGGTLTPVGRTDNAVNILPLDTPGYFDQGVGIVNGVTPGGTAQFVLRAWKDAASYDAAAERAQTATWTQTTGSWNGSAKPPTPASGPVLAVPTALVIVSQQALAATVKLNNYDANTPIYYKTSGALPGSGQKIYVQLLGGPVGGTLTPVKDVDNSMNIFPLSAPGYFDQGIGMVSGVTPGGTAQFVLRAWKDAASYDAAAEKGQSAAWTQITGTWNSAAVPPQPASGPTLAIPAAVVISSSGQTPLVATVTLNNYDAKMPIYYKTSGALAGSGQKIYVQLLGGPVGGTLTPVKDVDNALDTFPLSEPGYFDQGTGIVGGVTPGGTAQFILRAWKDAATFDAATEKGQTPAWTQSTGSWNGAAVPPQLPSGPVLAISAPLVIAPQGQQIIITSQPSDATVNALGTATFGVVATGPSLTYQWNLAGQAIPGATQPSLVINNVQLYQRGVYTCTIQGSGVASVTSAGATLTVRMGTFVNRQLPASVAPGQKFTVQLQVNIPAGLNVQTYAVEDTPPANWTVSNISHNGSTTGGTVRFGAFFDQTARTLTYDVTVPNTATDTSTFSGVGSAEGLSSAIGGPAQVSVIQYHPADINPSDWKISIDEVTAYGGAWRRGTTWSVPPNPIPIDYVTRAAFLWQNGEKYHEDATVTTPPLWWVPGTAALGRTSLVHSMGGAPTENVVTNETPGLYVPTLPFKVSLMVTPVSSVTGYAVEDQIPSGWQVENVSDGGELDAVNQRIKWGPFFDAAPRTLTYAVIPPKDASGTVTFVGTASFDGNPLPIDSGRQATASSSLSVRNQGPQNSIVLTLVGEMGAKYNLEASSDVTANSWQLITTLVNDSGTVTFNDPQAGQLRTRFYRAVRVQ